MIRIEVTGESIPEVADKLLALASQFQVTAAQRPVSAEPSVEQAAKPKATRKVKEVEPAAAPEPTEPANAGTANAGEKSEGLTGGTDTSGSTTSTSSTATSGASPSSTLDYDSDVFPVVIDTVGRIGRDRVVEILDLFGVTNAKHLDPERWAELVETLRGAQ